jgi:hypothetical protein
VHHDVAETDHALHAQGQLGVDRARALEQHEGLT